MKKILSVLALSFMMTSCFHTETPEDNHLLQVQLSDKINSAKNKVDYLTHQWKEVKDEKLSCPVCESEDIQFMKDRYDEGVTIVCKDCGNVFDRWCSKAYREKTITQQRLEDAESTLGRLNYRLKNVRQRSDGEDHYVFDFWETILIFVIGMGLIFTYKHFEA